MPLTLLGLRNTPHLQGLMSSETLYGRPLIANDQEPGP